MRILSCKLPMNYVDMGVWEQEERTEVYARDMKAVENALQGDFN